jgi:hypothetical protein
MLPTSARWLIELTSTPAPAGMVKPSKAAKKTVVRSLRDAFSFCKTLKQRKKHMGEIIIIADVLKMAI